MSIHFLPRKPGGLPAQAGVGLKAEHCAIIVETRPTVGFFEVHAENYMGAGGPPHRYLTAIRRHYPLSLHGVGLSIGADRPLDRTHLHRLKLLIERYEPDSFSEHLAWSSHDAGYFNDLLPIPYTTENLQRVIAHIDQVQDTLALQMLLENPATYLAFAQSSYSEADFIAEVARRSGCALLLDVNNIHVASVNQQYNSLTYIDNFPLAQVREIHLAGHARESDEVGRSLLIDTHDRPIDCRVWELYKQVIAKIGPTPTLIEWDANVPEWPRLRAEAQRAETLMFDADATAIRRDKVNDRS